MKAYRSLPGSSRGSLQKTRSVSAHNSCTEPASQSVPSVADAFIAQGLLFESTTPGVICELRPQITAGVARRETEPRQRVRSTPPGGGLGGPNNPTRRLH